MGYRNPLSSELYRTASLLSQKVSAKDKFFQEIALMGLDERLRYSIMYVIMEQDLLNKDLDKLTDKELLEDIIMPIIQRMGQAKFKTDVLTQLGMKIGKASTRTDWGEDEE
jgi:hypothetical protein